MRFLKAVWRFICKVYNHMPDDESDPSCVYVADSAWEQLARNRQRRSQSQSKGVE